MADERVNLTVDIDVKGERNLTAASAKLLAFERVAKRLETRTDRLSGSMSKLSGSMNKSGKSAQGFTRDLTLLEKVGGKFLKMARLIMFTVIAIGIEFGISALSIASVNAAFAIGRFAMRLYNYGMQALAGTMAAVGAAAIGAAAAFREFQAAQYQFRYKDSAQLGSALDQSSQNLRSLYQDATLATFGVQALAGAFAAVSKSTAFTPASKNALKAMADFAQASGDPGKSLQAAASFIGLLQKEKKFTAEAVNAAKQISPEFDKAFKKGSYKNMQSFMDDLMSGKLAAEAGVAGQADAISRTLFGQFKVYISQALVEISDVGQRVLEPIKKAMFDIFQGLTRTFRRISGDLVTFGRGPFLNSLVALTAKIEDFAVLMFRKFLPATEGFWKRTSDFFKGFAIYFREVRDALDPLRDGGSIVIKTFGKPIIEIFRQIGKGVTALDEQAVKYKDDFLEFGDALKNVVQGFFEISRAVREAFATALPIINPLLTGLGNLMKMIAGIISQITGKGGSVGAVGLIGGLTALAFKGRRSARFDRNRGFSPSIDDMIYGGQPLGAGGAVAAGGLGSLSGAMSSATTAAMAPAAGALSGSAAALSSAAAAISAAAVGSTLRGGMGGGSVDPTTGRYKTLPRRKPGQSNADYQRDIIRYVTRNRGMSDLPLEQRGYRAPTLYSGRPGTNIAGRQIGVSQDLDAIGMRMMTREQYEASFRRSRMRSDTPTGPHSSLLGTDAYRYRRDAQMQRSGFFPGRQYTTIGGRIRGFPGAFRSNMRSMKEAAQYGLYQAWLGKDQGGAAFAARQAGISGAMGAGGVSAAAGGIKGGILRGLLGQNYGTTGYRGFGTELRGQLGFAKAGPGGNMYTRAVTGLKGGNFGAGYRLSKENFNKAVAEGKLPANAKFSKFKGLKAGARAGFSGMGVASGLLAGMAIDNLSQRGLVSEEATGALQTGAGLMSINPLLGVAVGAGLTALSAKTKKGGMVAGAVSGAAIGGMIAGPLGVAVGSLVGAGLGALAANRNQKKAVAAAMGRIGEAQISSIAAATLAGAAKGSTAGGRQMLTTMTGLSGKYAAAKSTKERQALLKPYIDAGIIGGNDLSLATGDKNKDATAKLKEISDTMRMAVGPQLDQFDEIMKALKQSTGMTSEAIFDLAMRKNVNLYDTTLTLTDAVKKLGVGMVKTATELRNGLRDVQVASLDVFAVFKKTKEMKDVLQASGGNIRGGDTSTEAFLDYYTKSQDLSNYLSPDTPLMNMITMAQNFGTGANVGKGKLFGPGGPLAGIAIDPTAAGLIGKAQSQAQKGSVTQLSSQLGAMLSSSGFTFSDVDAGTKSMEQQINALITKATGGDTAAMATLNKLEGDLARGTALKGKSQEQIAQYFNSIFGAGSGASATAPKMGTKTTLFGQSLETELSGQLDPFAKVLTAEAATMRQGFMDAIKSGFFEASDTPDWWDTAPSWWSGGFEAELDKDGKLMRLISMGDTSTPKAGKFGDTSTAKNLRRTMSRHSSFDGMITGKRTVTSSLRDFNLGSPSSDHATGNAYDLVGQNLGQYAGLIKSAGGFAEFHGGGGSRHLHVVPPPGPMGDTSTSVLAKMSGGTGSNNYEGDTYNITVNSGGDAQATARAVAQEIMKMQKNWKQRS